MIALFQRSQESEVWDQESDWELALELVSVSVSALVSDSKFH
jgi:hypothetical protein